MDEEGPIADVNTYLLSDDRTRVIQVTSTVRQADGTDVRFTLPFSETKKGDTRHKKYRREYTKVLEALKSGKATPYGEKGWRVSYEGGEALIGFEISEVYCAGADEKQRLNLKKFIEALEEICSEPGHIRVSKKLLHEKPTE